MTDLRLIFLISIGLFLVLAPDSIWAQEEENFNSANTSSPRDTLKSFIDACNEVHRLGTATKNFNRYDPKHIAVIDRAVDCIDQSEFPAFARDERAAEVVVCIKEILDRIEMPPWEEIPDSAMMNATQGEEKLTHYRIPDSKIKIARVEGGDRQYEYLFTPGTAERAFPYYQRLKTQPYRTGTPQVSDGLYEWFVAAPGHPALASTVDQLPHFLGKRETLGIANWKWFGLLVTLLISIAAIWMAYRGYINLNAIARERSIFLYWLTLGFPIVAMLVPLLFKYCAYRILSVRSGPLYFIDFVSILAALVGALVVVFATSNRIAATVIASPQINPAGLNAQLIRILSKISSLVASVVLFLFGGQYLGIPIGTLLASAGIGGVAIALGAQDSLKTLFGTLNLLTDKPFRVGDRILFGSYDGVVEDIGLQSSRVRLLNGSQLTVPNDQLSSSDIENAGRRKYIRRVGRIHIPLDSNYEKVQKAVAILREELDDHEGMTDDHPPRVFFDDFTLDAHVIKFYYWYSPANFWDFKAFGDKLNFAIFQKFEAEGIQFSLPSRHSFWKEDNVQGPLDVNLIDDRGPDTA